MDWDETLFSKQRQRIDAFATARKLEIFHRY